MKSLHLFAMMSVVLVALSTNAIADTQAFKCTAEDGKISYLDTRPATGCVTIEVVHVNVGRGSTTDAQTDADAASTNEAADAKALTEKKEQVKKECETKRSNLKTVKTKAYVKVKDEDGKEKVMTPEELVQMAKEIQSYLDNFCSP